MVTCAHLFDSHMFQVSSAEALLMDPNQRLLLELGYAALHDNGLDRLSLLGTAVGVHIGFAVSDFVQLLTNSTRLSVFLATGYASSIACGRLSFVLGLQGSCISYDTACSSGLVACDAATSTLSLGVAHTCLVASAFIMLTPWVSIAFAVAGMTSQRGRCRTFDASADGYARGEACSSFVVSATERKVARVLGSAVQQDGRSASLTAPNGQSQKGEVTCMKS